MTDSNLTKNSRIIDRWTELSQYLGHGAVAAGIILVVKLFLQEPVPFKQTLQEYFPIVLLVFAYIIYISRIFRSIGALARKKDFWIKIDDKFKTFEHFADDTLKYLASIIILIAYTCAGFAKFEHFAKYFQYYFLLIIILSVGWQFIISRRIKILVKEGIIVENEVTKALSSWVLLDFLLGICVGLSILFSRIEYLKQFPLVYAHAVFWFNLFSTIQDCIKNGEILWGNK